MDASRNVHEVWAAQCVNRSCVASLSFLVWDVITTFDEEIEFIWRKPMTWTRFLFLFIRYFAVAVQVALLFVGTELALAMQVLITSVEIVLMLRVQALYAHNKFIKRGVVVLLVIEFVVMATCEYYTVVGLEFDSTCIVTKSSYAILGYGAAAIVYELFLFSLTLIKFVHAFRTGWSDTPVLQLLVWDGTWAFALIFLAMLVNAICYGAISGGLSAVAFTWLMSVLAFAGCRLMLNMHALGAPAAQTPYTTREREADRTLHETHLDFGAMTRDATGAYTDVGSSDASTGFLDSADAYRFGEGTFILKDMESGQHVRTGKAEEFELAKIDKSSNANDHGRKGKGKMASPTARSAHAYRRSPLSSLSLDFASLTSSTGTSTIDRDRERKQGSSSGSYSTPALEGLALIPDTGKRLPGDYRNSKEQDTMSPTTPLSADPLMRDWCSTTIPPTNPG